MEHKSMYNFSAVFRAPDSVKNIQTANKTYKTLPTINKKYKHNNLLKIKNAFPKTM